MAGSIVSSTNFLCSGYFAGSSGAPGAPTAPGATGNLKFNIFSSPTTVTAGLSTSNINTLNICVSVIPDITKPLVKVTGKWGYNNSIYPTTTTPKLFYFTTTGTNTYYIQSKFVTGTTTPYLDSNIYSTSKVASGSFLYNKCAILLSKNYTTAATDLATSNSLTVICKQSQSNCNLNFALLTTAQLLVAKNPYNVCVQISNSTGLISSTLYSSSNTTSSYFSVTLPTLNVDDRVEFILQKVSNSTSSAQSCLFIDLDSLLFVTPSLELTSSATEYTYGSEDLMNFSCNFSPTNIVGDTINNQYVKLLISNYATPFYGKVQGNTISFNSFDKNLLSPSDYTTTISYNPYDTYTTGSTNKSNYALNYNNAAIRGVYPDAPSHYNSGSVSTSFTIKPQSISIEYNTTTLLSSYSLLKLAELTGFYIRDMATGTSLSNTDISGTSTFTIKDSNGTSVYTLSEITNMSSISFTPKDIPLKANSTYTFTLAFVPSSSNIGSSTSISYNFITETPILNYTVSNLLPGYTDTILLTANLTDSYGTDYDSVIPGTITYSVDTPTTATSYSIPFDTTTKYNNSFTPKDLHLLRYSQTEYTVSATFSNSDNLTLTKSDLQFTYNGVSVNESIDKMTAYVYDTLTLTSSVVDNNTQAYITFADLPGQMSFILSTTSSTITETKTINSDSVITHFIPNTYSIAYTGIQESVTATFTPTDTLISAITSIPSNFTIQKFQPTITLTDPSSHSFDLYYTDKISVQINGIGGHNDLGTLTLFDMNDNELTQLFNISANINNIDIEPVRLIDLLGSPADLSTIDASQIITGKIKWTANKVNIYNDADTTFNNNLTKTTCSISSINVGNNGCTFMETMTITGQISSPYSELVGGTIELYDKDADAGSNSLVSVIVNNNAFSMTFNSDIVKIYNLYIKFIPTYLDLYNESQSSEFTATFIQKTITVQPTIVNYTLFNSTYNILYTDNFTFHLSGLLLISGAEIQLKIGDLNTTYSLTIDSDGNAISSSLNMVLLTSNASIIGNTNNVSLFSINNYRADLFIINYLPVNIIFSENLTIPTFTSMIIQDQTSSTITPNSSNQFELNFNDSYNLFSTFSLISSTDQIIPIEGELKVIIDNNVSYTLVSSLILSEESIQQIASFKPVDFNVSATTHSFKLQFIPLNTNISDFESSPISIIVIKDMLKSIDFSTSSSTSNDISYYAETFNSSITFTDIGLIGNFKVYCASPDNDSTKDLLLATALFSTDTDSIGQSVTLNMLCNAITFDCITDPTTFSLYVRFISTDTNYSDNTFTGLSVDIYKIAVYINQLTINSQQQFITEETGSDYYYNGINVYTGDQLTISGNIKTINHSFVKFGDIKLMTYEQASDDGNYYDITSNLISTNSIDINGYFEFTITLDVNSIVYPTDSASIIQFVYKNMVNYTTNYFTSIPGFDIVPGLLSINISNPSANLSLSQTGTTTQYYYHEDLITFEVHFDNSYDSIHNGLLQLTINDIDNNVVGNSPYTMIITNHTDKGFATISLNPKTEGIFSMETNYVVDCLFTCIGFQDTNTTDDITFNVLKTTPIIHLDLIDSTTGYATTTVDYEGNVNIGVKVYTQRSIASGVVQTTDIIGSVILSKQSNSSYTDMNVLMNSSVSANILFDNNSSEGVIVNYSPKENCPAIILNESGINAIFTPVDTLNYNPSQLDTSYSFTINKHSIVLSIDTITTNLDILHTGLNANNVDDQNIYYENNSSSVKFNGFINKDEPFQSTCSLSKNIPGQLTYKYSLTGSSPYTSLIPNSMGPLVSPVQAVFDSGLISIQQNSNSNSYVLNTTFTPNQPSFYNVITSALGFNLYETNTFGTGFIDFDNSPTTITIQKTISYSSQTYNIYTNIAFDSSIPVASQMCLVQLYYGNFDYPLNVAPQYLTHSSPSTSFIIPKNVLPYKAEPYLIKALFTPTMDTTSISVVNRNHDYPIIAYERSPLTLTIKPSLEIVNPSNSYTYNYGDALSANISIHSGAANIGPYSKFVITTTNALGTPAFNASSEYLFNATTVGDTTIHITRFDQLLSNSQILNDSLIPGSYNFTILAKSSDNISQTELLTQTIIVSKKPVILTMTTDNHYKIYRDSMILTFNIENYPINNGSITVNFVNVNNASDVNVKTILYSELTTADNITYTYTWTDISNLLSTNSYNMSATLNNQNFSGSYTDTSSALIINKNNNCSIMLTTQSYNAIYHSKCSYII